MNPIGEAFGDIDCFLAHDTVRSPDISIFIGARRNFDVRKIPVRIAPDIAVEILSPSEKAMDVHRKVLDLLRAGCTEVWLLDEANLEVFVHTDNGVRVYRENDTLQTPLLPGFTAVVRDLFAAS